MIQLTSSFLSVLALHTQFALHLFALAGPRLYSNNFIFHL